MRIAQISPLMESVPPKYYGGTERIVHYLTEELVRQGHDVTLFASGDSETSADLVPICPEALRLKGTRDPLAYHVLELENAFKRGREFDIIHSHVDYLAFPLSRRLPDTPVVTTLHGRLDLPELADLYREYSDVRLISISHAQRAPLTGVNWVGTVHHGLPRDRYRFNPRPGGYAAFLGRVSPEKRLDFAIAAAIRAGMRIEVAAKVDRVDEDYFQERIKPMLDHPLVGFHGEIGEDRKAEFLGGASALLFPVDWPEPFGLVMIESMACGTPVIARRRGSVPEVIREGVSGFLAETEEEMAEALGRVAAISRRDCRRYFEDRFTARRMADDYLALYQKVIESRDADLAEADGDGRTHGGSDNPGRQVLHNGQLLAGGKADPGPQAGRHLRRLR